MYYQITNHLYIHYPLSRDSVRKANSHCTAGHNSQLIPAYGMQVKKLEVFFDLQKAFDSVPHQALLDKLRDLQLNDFILKWICDYLMQRKQSVAVNGQTSDTLTIWIRKSRGSITEP